MEVRLHLFLNLETRWTPNLPKVKEPPVPTEGSQVGSSAGLALRRREDVLYLQGIETRSLGWLAQNICGAKFSFRNGFKGLREIFCQASELREFRAA